MDDEECNYIKERGKPYEEKCLNTPFFLCDSCKKEYCAKHMLLPCGYCEAWVY